MFNFISGMFTGVDSTSTFDSEQLPSVFKSESEFLKTQRTNLIVKMKEDNILLIDGYRPNNLRGASVLSDWKAQREQRGIANAVQYTKN